MSNPEVTLTLEDCVDEVLGLLTGLDLSYDSSLDRFRSIVRQINRALRSNALEKEWSYYASTVSVGPAVEGERVVHLRSSLRPRIINDDAVRLCKDEHPVVWAYFLPRDAIHKYESRKGLWVAATRQTLEFSRPFNNAEDGLDIQVPVMREPVMFRLPEAGGTVPTEVLNQELDFPYPDLITLRAAYYYAQTDPVMQPRVQTIEAQYKDLMYQIIERDDRNTDSPYQNDFYVPVQSALHTHPMAHPYPHSDWGRWA